MSIVAIGVPFVLGTSGPAAVEGVLRIALLVGGMPGDEPGTMTLLGVSLEPEPMTPRMGGMGGGDVLGEGCDALVAGLDLISQGLHVELVTVLRGLELTIQSRVQ